VVRLVVNDETPPLTNKLGHPHHIEVKALCLHIEKMQTRVPHRLELKVDKGRLLKLRSERSRFQIDKKQPSVSLQYFIREGPRSLTEKTKRILAVLLSYAVLHLHGTPWLQPTWDSSQILFFQCPSSKIPLRPFIEAQLGWPRQQELDESSPRLDRGHEEDGCHSDSDWDDLDPDDVEHPFPALVTLAVMLMELYLVTPFDSLARNRGIEIPEGADNRTRSLDVALVFDEYKREIPENSHFYSAIEKCLDPRTWQDERSQKLTDRELRARLYEEVVQPLEDELCDAFTFITIEELDKIAETVDIGSWGQAIQHQQMGLNHLRYPQPSLVARYGSVMTASRSTLPKEEFRHITTPEYETGMFFDNEKSSKAHSSSEYVCHPNPLFSFSIRES
jgi:hypothetical protein